MTGELVVPFRGNGTALRVFSGAIRPSVQTLGEGEGSPKATRPGVENGHLFLAGNRAVLLGNRRFSWREIA